MNLGALAGRIGAIGPANGDHLVMVQDTQTNRIYSITGVLVERHDDADGRSTVWLQVEEY